jgi:enoyl-CoA hydratase/carnithine racemase
MLGRAARLARTLMHTSKSDLIKLKQSVSTRIIELNRPAQLNSLNSEMIDEMTTALKIYADAPFCSAVVIKSAADGDGSGSKRVFCAGGDVVSLVKAVEAGRGVEEGVDFFRREYALNHLVGTFPKPIISILDGVTSIHYFTLIN